MDATVGEAGVGAAAPERGGGRLVRCPRCGYDQRGEVLRWRERCPLSGTCSECGLSLDWGEVIRGGSWPPDWHVESPTEAVGWRTLRTLAWSLRPGVFWRRVRMEQSGRPARAMRYGVVATLLVVLAVGAVDTAAQRIANGSVSAMPGRGVTGSVELLQYAQEAVNGLVPLELAMFEVAFWQPASSWWRTRWYVYLAPEIVVFAAFVACVPLSYLLLPLTLRSARVRPWHIARAAIYHLPATLLLADLWVVFWAAVFANSHSSVSIAPAEWVAFSDHAAAVLLRSPLPWAAFALWIQYRWWAAVNLRYLRLPRARLVTVAALVIPGLMATIWLASFTNVLAELVYLKL